jgi:hypothetical protein
MKFHFAAIAMVTIGLLIGPTKVSAIDMPPPSGDCWSSTLAIISSEAVSDTVVCSCIPTFEDYSPSIAASPHDDAYLRFAFRL